MNYLRDALTAASQYYKDLPPINPSTLTGAIDVLVIERPAADGGVELTCSPFHVRFGKWQVLRPGDKRVNVLVNGRSIPFDMKIGDAGEAFFVFATDEDVPDDLITSPLLQAADIDRPEGQIDASIGKVNVKGKRDGEDPSIPPEESVEPEFLDLDASGSETSRNVETKLAEPLISITTPFDPSLPSYELPSSAQPAEQQISVNDSLAFMENDRRTNMALMNAAMEEERAKADSRKVINIHDGFGEGIGDELLPTVDERDARPPDVTYHHDVVLDVSGYHAREDSDRTILASDDNMGSARDEVLITIITPDTSRASSPESTGAMSDARISKESSDRLEYSVSSSPPEYSWEWGGFPQRSAKKQSFSTDASDVPRQIGFTPQPVDVAPKDRMSLPRSRSPISDAALADSGRLEGDAEDPHRIWVNLDGQKLTFELSLCGDTIHGEEAVEDAKHFATDQVTFTRFLEDPEIAHNRDLVFRWDDEYTSLRDNSALMDALVSWRRRTLSPTATPVANGSQTQVDRPALSAARPATSTWSRWWGRNRALPDVQEPSTVERNTSPQKNQPHPRRPSLEHSSSAPVNSVLSDPKSTAGPPSSVPFPSAAQISGTRTKYAKTLRLTSDQLKSLDLKKGPNSITFSLSATGQVACTARIFLWDSTDHVVVSDIDGTITKSDALGHVFTMIGRDWTHLGVAKLYTDIYRNGYKIMYLTSRAIGQADSTRDYLKGINQNNYQLPEGPVIMSPDRLLTSLHREVIMRKPEVFKMACLRDIQRLFGPSTRNAFYAGFGNKITDALSYRSVNIPSARIFTIDTSGVVKMELLELAGYKSSYIHMTALVDQMFPPINRKWAPEYTDFNYWRTPVQEYELPDALSAPPSPTLSASARSDTSNQSAFSRLRHFSFGRSSSRSPAPEGSRSSTPARDESALPNRHVRAISAFDRLGGMLASESSVSVHEKDKNKESGQRVYGIDANARDGELEDVTRERRLRMTASLPSSMEDRILGMRDPRRTPAHGVKSQEYDAEEDEYEEDEEDEVDDEDEEDDAEQAFDDDLLATGEMENVPYL